MTFDVSSYPKDLFGDVRIPVVQLAAAPGRRDEISGLAAEVPELTHLKAKRFHRIKFTRDQKP